MKKLLILLLLTSSLLPLQAQYDLLSAKKGVIKGCYNFWVYTPEEYYYTQETTPLIIFLHGASLCGRDLNRVLRYGSIDAAQMGLMIPALIVAPQNPGGWWDPHKLNEILEWMKLHYVFDESRVYVLGMSLGGYGTLDFAGTYPDKIAAAIALCGGATLKDYRGLGELPLWIVHGTADTAVPVSASDRVVEAIKKTGDDSRLIYTRMPGINHGRLARLFYCYQTYDWMFSHSLKDEDRPINRDFEITPQLLQNAYHDLGRNANFATYD